MAAERGRARQSAERGRARAIARWAMVAIYLAAGVLHLAVPGPFARITPAWVPHPLLVVQLTGLCELAGAVGLMTRRFRRAAGVGLALYAVGVFPANVQHAVHDLGGGHGLGWWYHAPRLFAQPFIMAWALWVGEVWRSGGDSSANSPRSRSR